MSGRRGERPGAPNGSPRDVPRIARRLVAWLVEEDRVAEVREDLLHVYRVHERLHGSRSARRRYWKEVLGLLRWRRGGRRGRLAGALVGLRQDLRLAGRTLLHRPGASAVAVATLALGIGLSTTMFTVLEAVVLRPLRLPRPEGVVRVVQHSAERQRAFVSGPDFIAFREALVPSPVTGGDGDTGSFVDLAAFQYQMPTLLTDTGARLVQGARVSPWFFRMLGIEPALGRDFARLDGARVEDGVVILGHALWQRAFGGDPEIIGRSVELPPRRYTVIGVLPPDLDLPGGRELWTTLDLADAPWMRDRTVQPFMVFGRLADGTSLRLARDRLARVARRLARDHPATNEGLHADLEPLRAAVIGDVGRPLGLLLAAVGVVLLVACLNVANLMLASGASRRQELAMHVALGATRGRLLRRTLMETSLVAAVGGALGLAAARAGLGAVQAVVPAWLPRLEGLAVNGTVAAFAVAITAASALVAGIGPAWQAAAGSARGAALLRDESAPVRTASRRRGVSVLLVVEFALSAMLLVGAGLLLRSLGHLDAVDLGLRHRDVHTFRISIPGDRNPVIVTDRLREELGSLAGVGVEVTSHLPLSGQYIEGEFAVRGRPLPSGPDRPRASLRLISPGYFGALEIPLRRGRALREEDVDGGRRVAVINQTMARRYWPDGDPLGEQLAFTVGDSDPGPEAWIEVVGIVADVRHMGPGQEPLPELYLPYRQGGQVWDWIAESVAFLLVAPRGLPTERQVRSVVAEVGPTIPAYAFVSLEDFLAGSTADTRLAARVLEIFSALALLLAGVGIYGVVSFTVRRRTRDIGIRKALGAARGAILREVVSGSLRTALLGGAIGLGAAALLGRALAHLLHGVAPPDIGTFGAVAALILVAAALASWIPARRAAAVDPARALRGEGG